MQFPVLWYWKVMENWLWKVNDSWNYFGKLSDTCHVSEYYCRLGLVFQCCKYNMITSLG